MTLEGEVLLPDGRLEAGRLVLVDGLVQSFRPGPTSVRRLVLPGFVDVHVHGGAGHDAMDGPEGVLGLARFHATKGTTAVCPTTVTAAVPELERVLRGVALAQREGAGTDRGGNPVPRGARILGAHVEGPFISEKRLGAQPRHARAPETATLERLLAAGPVSIVTLAPELEGALDLVRVLTRAGVRASLGHSDSSLEPARAAFAAGARGATHLWNAMTGVHHRNPGLAVAALEQTEAFLELILDGHHVHPALLDLTLRAAKGRVCLVTDAIRAAGQGDRETELGGQAVTVHGGRATLADGTLAGSVLTLDQALRHAVAAGLSVARAGELLARNPADYLGRRDLGRFEPGARADAVVLTPDLAIERVLVGGNDISL